MENVVVIIPTYNAEPHWQELSASLHLQGLDPSQVLIVDSSSQDATRSLALRSGYRVFCIPKHEFGHGATRQLATERFTTAEFVVFLTQDAVLQDADSIQRLCSALHDDTVGAAYGRQAPRTLANPIERHARLFNYPAVSQTRTFECRKRLGIKAAFCSNSFAVYRRSALLAIGGFPRDVILAEDSIVAARILMAGWKVVYQADAVAVHSHPLGIREEFSRYFDTGVHHSRERWLLETFGGASSEGKSFLKSEFRFLKKAAPHLIPLALLRTASKLSAYRLGRLQSRLPMAVTRRLTGYPNFWSGKVVTSTTPAESVYPPATTFTTRTRQGTR